MRFGRKPGQTTQAAAARRSGIPQPTISAWLAGRRNLPWAHQVTLARSVGLTVVVTVKVATA